MATFSVEEYIKHIDVVIDKLQNDLATTLEEVWAKDMVSRITNRVENDAKNADGGSFSPYSPKYLKWKKAKKGFLGEDKNFALTREMWDKFNVTNRKRKAGFFEVTLAGTNADAQIKINVNSKREDRSIIEPSEKEEEAQRVFLEKWIFDFLSKEL